MGLGMEEKEDKKAIIIIIKISKNKAVFMMISTYDFPGLVLRILTQ